MNRLQEASLPLAITMARSDYKAVVQTIAEFTAATPSWERKRIWTKALELRRQVKTYEALSNRRKVW